MTFRMSSLSSRWRQSMATVPSSIVLWTTATITVTTISLYSSSKTSLEQSSKDNDTSSDSYFQLDVNVMDKIAAKPYLPVTQKRNVPKRLRLLVIDVPEMRFQGIDGECRVNFSRQFPDNVAPPKVVVSSGENNKNHHSHLKVIQKSLAHALVKCRSRETKRIGVELTEASVAHLNPHNMRRTHQFGSFEYDPGKYASKNTTANDTQSSNDEEEEVVVEEVVVTDNDDQVGQQQQAVVNQEKARAVSISKRATVLATKEDEIDAPWNQYAWIQELQLRVGGKVQFGEPMQPSSRMQRLLFGSVYKTTIPSSRGWWQHLLLFPMFQSNPAGQDAPDQRNWASNKPHAVLADGAAMQRVPGSLRFLQRVCEENGVPLFIINDPRVWGGNTHQALPEALRDVRKTVKQQVVENAMQRGSSFQRGRMLGQAETEAKWQAKDMGRRTRQVIRETNEQLKQEREKDWSQLNEKELQGKLVERKVIREGKKGESNVPPEYTSGMVDLSKTCIANEEERRKQQAEAADKKKEESNTKPEVIAS